MTWFFIALIGPLLWSLVNHADKFLLSDNSSSNSSVGSLMIFSTFAGVLVIILTPLFANGLFSIDLTSIFVLVIVGFLAALAIMLYLYALETDEASIVVPFFQLIPVFAYFFAYFFLNETLSYQQIIGSIIVIVGAAILSIEFHEEKGLKVKGKIAILMILSSLIFAFYETIFKIIAVDDGFAVSIFWEHVGLLIFGLILFILFKSYRREFLQTLKQKNQRTKILSVNIGSETFTLIGNVAVNYALLLAPVALVMVVSGYQPLFVFLVGIFLTIFFPKIAQERLTLKHLLHKSLAIILMIIGSSLLL